MPTFTIGLCIWAVEFSLSGIHHYAAIALEFPSLSSRLQFMFGNFYSLKVTYELLITFAL